MVSDDLLHWKQLSWLIEVSKLPPDCPYNGRFWAPEIHFIKNKFYLKFQDTQDPYQETGHNALFEGPDGQIWNSCHYFNKIWV